MIIGVDPGKLGCFAFVDFTDDGKGRVTLLANAAGKEVNGYYGYDPHELGKIYFLCKGGNAWIEMPQTRFKNSAKSTLTTGVGYGLLLGALSSASQLTCVEAKAWKATLGLIGPGGPKEAKLRAIDFFQTTCVNVDEANAMRRGTSIALDGLADAFGIACYGYQQAVKQ